MQIREKSKARWWRSNPSHETRHQGVPEKELTNLSKKKGERAASIYLHDRKLQHVLKSGRAKIKEQFNSIAPSQA
jgi:hypothetical protein